MNTKRVLQKDTVLNVVEEVVDIEGKILRYQCRASSEEGHPCSYAQVNFVAGNFKRHLLSFHTKVARELGFVPKYEPPMNKLRISITHSNNDFVKQIMIISRLFFAFNKKCTLSLVTTLNSV